MSNESAQQWALRISQLNTRELIGNSFQERDVWQCQLGINIGHEQNGDQHSFTRPVLVVERFGQYLFWAVPLSTKTPSGSQHHHLFKHDSKDYSALVTQLRVLDSRRLTRKLYELDAENFYQIKLHLARYLLRT